jgi:hypothetical protein
MLPCELLEELIGRHGPTGLYVLLPLSDCIECFLIVLTLPGEVIGQGIIEGIGRALPSTAGEFFQLCQSLRFERYGVHVLKVEVQHVDVNSQVLPT